MSLGFLAMGKEGGTMMDEGPAVGGETTEEEDEGDE
jgi:hypothetical protein